MAWIRLSDDYNDHPKFTCLSHGAFRLWHQGMGFCRKFKTDGDIPTATVRGFKAFTSGRMKELLTPWKAGHSPLWHATDDGVRVHDYLDWNPSRDDEQQRQTESKERIKDWRARKGRNAVGNTVTHDVRTQFVPDRTGSEKLLEKNDPKTALDARAGELLQKYQELFVKHRRGARYHARPALDFPKACELVQTWTDDKRLSKMIEIVLTTNDEWIARTDRGFAVFVARATWADDRLREWEEQNGITA